MGKDALQKLSGEGNFFALHHYEREENRVAEQNAGYGKERDEHLTEAGDLARAFDDALGNQVSDQDGAIKKDVVDGVSHDAPGDPAENGSADAKDQAVGVVWLDCFVVHRGAIQFLMDFL